jgi:adenylate cyclase class 2
MPLEIEAKMRIEDLPALETKLRELRAPFEGEIFERNTYFDTPGADLRRADRGLRMRIEQHEGATEPLVILTHKGPRAHGPLKTRQETELTVADASGARALLEALGYEAALTFEKRRKTWRIEACLVQIDVLPRLGRFVEIEGPSDRAVFAVRERLDLADAPLISTSYIGLLKAHLEERGLQDREVTFD